MNRQPFAKPPRWWSPKLNRWWVYWWRPWRKRLQLNKHRLLSVEVRGLEHVREARARGHGILLTPNHSSHADPFVLYAAADELRCPFYVMIAWQNFIRDGWLKSLVLRHHGASVWIARAPTCRRCARRWRSSSHGRIPCASSRKATYIT